MVMAGSVRAMASGRIRFGLQADLVSNRDEWLDLARKAEDLGFEALYVADHVGVMASPFAALAAAATVTSTLKLGTYVVNAGVRDPLALASDAATVDVVSNGRLILGLGAGHTPAEWTMSGRPYPSPAARVGRLAETLDVVTALLNGEVVTLSGRYVSVEDAHLLAPRPVSSPIRLLIGGNGTKVLRLGAQYADVVSLSGLGRTLEDGHRHEPLWSAASIDERVRIVRDASRERPEPPVHDALVQHVQITGRRADLAEELARSVDGITGAEVLGCPYMLIGTVEQLLDELHDYRDRWGFTSYVVRASAIAEVATLIERLA
jgi:probable F420-dependent oxidoreductase